MRDNNCAGFCQWTRMLTNRDTQTHTWNVTFTSDKNSIISSSQNKFTLQANQSISLQFSFQSNGGGFDEYRFAEVIISDDQNQTSPVRLTIAVKIDDDLIFANGFNN